MEKDIPGWGNTEPGYRYEKLKLSKEINFQEINMCLVYADFLNEKISLSSQMLKLTFYYLFA